MMSDVDAVFTTKWEKHLVALILENPGDRQAAIYEKLLALGLDEDLPSKSRIMRAARELKSGSVGKILNQKKKADEVEKEYGALIKRILRHARKGEVLPKGRHTAAAENLATMIYWTHMSAIENAKTAKGSGDMAMAEQHLNEYREDIQPYMDLGYTVEDLENIYKYTFGGKALTDPTYSKFAPYDVTVADQVLDEVNIHFREDS